MDIFSLHRSYCKQTVNVLIKRLVLWCLNWVCTVCRCPKYRFLSRKGLSNILVFRMDLFTFCKSHKDSVKDGSTALRYKPAFIATW